MNLIYLRRRAINFFNLTVSVLATAVWSVLAGVAAVDPVQQWSAVDRSVPVHQITPPPGEMGGLANAIVGSLMLTGVGILVGAPVGILAGTYLCEFGRGFPVRQRGTFRQ